MSDLQIPHEMTIVLDGAEWYMLSATMSWLKGVSAPVQVNPYKRRCSPLNLMKFKQDGEKGKSKVYVNRDGLKEIVERTRSISLDAKKLLGVASGVTSSEHVFESFLGGFVGELGFDIKRQFKVGDYSVDFVIDDRLAIEFDELSHSSYCKDRELLRESEIRRSGLDILRVSDSDNIGAALARVINALTK